NRGEGVPVGLDGFFLSALLTPPLPPLPALGGFFGPGSESRGLLCLGGLEHGARGSCERGRLGSHALRDEQQTAGDGKRDPEGPDPVSDYPPAHDKPFLLAHGRGQLSGRTPPGGKLGSAGPWHGPGISHRPGNKPNLRDWRVLRNASKRRDVRNV